MNVVEDYSEAEKTNICSIKPTRSKCIQKL